MDITFNIDFDADEVHGVIDNSISFFVIRDEDSFLYKHFDRIDDEMLQDKLKSVCKILLTLEDI